MSSLRGSERAAAMRTYRVAASIAIEDGGPATGIVSMNALERQRGVDAEIITTDAGERSPVPLAVPVDREGARVRYFRSHPPRRFKASIGLAWHLRNVRRVDVVHVHGLYLWHCVAAYFWCRLARVPYVVQPHGNLEPFQLRQSRRVKAAYDALVGRRLLRDAAAVLFASASELDRAQPRIPAGRGVVIGLGASVPDDDPGARFAWEPPPASRVVAFLGRITPKKRVDVLLEAWPRVLERVPDAWLLVAGPDELGLSRESTPQQVRFLGTVRGVEKARLLRRADLTALPSENENFAVSVAESLVAGTPVVVTRHVALSELVLETSAGLVIQEADPSELATAITSLLQDRAALDAATRACSALAAPRVTWEAPVSRLLETYARITRDGKGRP